MNAFLIDGIRTPIGSFGGTLSTIRTDDLAAITISELIKRNPSLDPSAIGDVILGCANQAGEDNRNVARMSLLLAGLPFSVPGETVNRLCASGLSAAVNGSRMLTLGDADVVIAGGVENMTRGPWVMSKASKAFGRDSSLFDTSFGWRFINPKLESIYGVDGMGVTAENLVDMYGISREDQDAFAFRSHMKATKARDEGRLAEEIIPVMIPRRKQDALSFEHDEFIKPGTTLEILQKLRPAFRKEGGSVTAGNASGLNDGSAALLLANENGLKSQGLEPLAEIVSSAVVGVEPRIMGIGPVKASEIALKRAGIGFDDLDVIELNEAFSAQSLACIRQWNLSDNDPRINPNGGGISLGHPLGMTGSRILLAAARQLKRTGGKFGLVTLCIGVGQGYAVVIKNAATSTSN
ncbi:MAG TPA: acetyl-CoA C-acyltransferase [Flavobacteriales bacterium]|nr:acetyl-CoA C-acyltransferase [Flavobacteriales bacterium]HIN41013.1 acetyl-CoA C-acyltransferase [Flavobacteriales bacterium]HIO60186.1 acetyl-CoA C-acyltransferase [Flavobacteriales bacterium]